MQIIEIEEPGKRDLQEEIVVGIDFGTTNSLIAYSKDNNPQIINSVGKNGLLPSVIFYDDQLEKFLIGKNRGEKNSISSIKRLLSKSYEEIKSTEVLHKILSDFVLVDYTSSMPKVTFGTTKYSFPELAAKIFLFLKEHAEQELGSAISRNTSKPAILAASITVPLDASSK